ncbi:hypothetical protein D3C80_1182130 [compost metagenome]
MQGRVGADQQITRQLIRTEHLERMSVVVRQQAFGTVHQGGLVEVLRRTGVILTIVGLHVAFEVTAAF